MQKIGYHKAHQRKDKGHVHKGQVRVGGLALFGATGVRFGTRRDRGLGRRDMHPNFWYVNLEFNNNIFTLGNMRMKGLWQALSMQAESKTVDMMRCGCWLLDLSLLLNLRGELALLFLLEHRGAFQTIEFTTALHDKLEILVLACLHQGGHVSARMGSIPVLQTLRLILKESVGLALSVSP